MTPPDPAKRLDVLMLFGACQLRGSYARTMCLANSLPKTKVRVRIVSTDVLRLPIESQDIQVSRYLRIPGLQLAARRFLATDLEQSPPDLIDIQHRHLHGLGAWLARQLKRPYLVTVHDYLGDRERFVIDPKWCRQVIAVSESVRSELLERTGLHPEMVSVIASGVTPPVETSLMSILQDNRCPVIGTAGPLEVGKGLNHFLQAANEVRKTHPQALFVIAGAGPEERSLRRLSLQLRLGDTLTILSNLNDFRPAMQAMDIFVLPALKQGLGTIMLEAMARGLPVIGTQSGGVFSVVTDGVNGLLVPPSDEMALADKIRYLLDQPQRARELGAAARQHVVQNFQVVGMIEAIYRLYQGACTAAY